MSWSSLPDDVVELILSRLSLVELARVSTTCSTFRARYRRQLALEHEARCGLAVNYFGRERITSLTAAIIQLLKGGPLDPWSFYDSAVLDRFLRGDLTFDPTALIVSAHPHHRLPIDVITVQDCNPTWNRLVVEVPWDRKGVQIHDCTPGDGEDVEMVALVQAILSGGLAQFIHDAGKWCQFDISRHWWVFGNLDVIRRAGLKAQIGPLMQFASHCICTESTYVDMPLLKSVSVRYRLHIGEAEPAADEEAV